VKLNRLGKHRSTVQSREHISGKGLRIYRCIRPWISLSAKWLADAGFKEGDGIEIHTYSGALIIVRAPDADKEAA